MVKLYNFEVQGLLGLLYPLLFVANGLIASGKVKIV